MRPGGAADWHLVRWLHNHLMVKVAGSNHGRIATLGIEYAITRGMRATKKYRINVKVTINII